MSDPLNAPLAVELLREDFAGLYREHSRANDDFANKRFRTLLAVEAVPLLALGGLLSNGAEKSANLDLFLLPGPMYLVFFASFGLGLVVLEMWIRSAIVANTYARAINQMRGFYWKFLPPPMVTCKPWLPTTPREPSWQGARHLAWLAAIPAAINFLYLCLAASWGYRELNGPGVLPAPRAYGIVVLLSVLVGIVQYVLVLRRLWKQQESVDTRVNSE